MDDLAEAEQTGLDSDSARAAETGTPETGTPETGTPETGTPESGTPESGTAAESFTVSELLAGAKSAIAAAFPTEVWVTGEVTNLSRPASGHVYFSLVDPDAPSNKPISMKVTLFKWYKKHVNQMLTRAHGQIRMDNGVQVRVRGTVDLYEQRGELSFRMTAIDPNFTIGVLQAQRTALLRSLAESGLLRANAQRPLSPVPLRVALITSIGSAAAADFTDEINKYGYAFDITVIDARVQGVDSPTSIVEAIGTAETLDVDVIALVRGGGAQTDLASFDSETVATAIAHCCHPVICGIGHEIDTSVADMVAHTAVKTPTAAAQFLVGMVAAAEDLQETLWHNTCNAADRALSSVAQRVDATMRRLSAATAAHHRTMSHHLDLTVVALKHRAGLRGQTDILDRAVNEIRTVTHRLDRAERSLDQRAAAAEMHNPTTLAARGFLVARNESGKLVRRMSDAPVGGRIDVLVADGRLIARVEATDELAGQREPARSFGTKSSHASPPSRKEDDQQ